ncbi:MAG: peptidase MA family metallohydrolase [Dehalococcoidales bacterium]
MKKKIFIVLAAISLLVLLVPVTAQASSGLVVSPSLAVVNFPTSVIISISAESDVNITDIRLHYTVERKSYAQVVAEAYITFVPAKKVETQWVLDLRRTGTLPPGTNITYWLTVADASGSRIETIPSVIHLEDNRYDWKTIQEGQVTLHWYSGNESFAGELMAAAQTALTRLADNTGAELESSVNLYIYANATDLQGAMIDAQDWTGGVAFSEYGTIAIGIGTSQDEVDWGKRTIAHELTHMVLYQVTSNPYNYLPLWLNEGMAMFSEGTLELSFVLALSSADANHSFLTVQSLCSPFPTDYNQAVLAYAESYKIVSYLINEYGREKMFELLNVFKQGSGYNEALLKVYCFNMDELNSLWRTEPVAVYGS